MKMELRNVLLCAVLLVLAVPQSSARHRSRREADAEEYSEVMNDEGNEDTQNDADGGDEGEEVADARMITHPMTYNATIGLNYQLQCKTDPLDASVVTEWYRNGKKIILGRTNVMTGADKDRINLVNGSNDLLIQNIQFSDSGDYICKVQQETPASVTHKVVVLESPNIRNFSATIIGDTYLREGVDVLLNCNVTGYPVPDLIWSRNAPHESNKRLTAADGVMEGTTFLLRNVTRKDSGEYYCYAVSGDQHAQAELKLDILGPPRVHVHKTTVNSAINVSTILQCTVHEEKTPTINWYKNNVRLTPTETIDIKTEEAQSNLTVTPAKDEDFGVYTCEAVNGIGRHHKSINLVQLPVVEDLSVDNDKLMWTIHSHQPLEKIEIQLNDLGEGGKYLTIDVPLPKEPARNYEITFKLDETQIKPGKYAAAVRVKNNHGWNENADITPIPVDIVAQPEPIQTASVIRPPGNSGVKLDASTTAVLSTILMYLLVRMF